MVDLIDPNDWLNPYRNLCREEANLEGSHSNFMFLHDEESRLRGIIEGLKPNADFQRKYFRRQLEFCLQLLKLWEWKRKAANRAWKATLRARDQAIQGDENST